MQLKYNSILIQSYIAGMNNKYDVLYNNFYNTWQYINNLSVEYTAEKMISLYDSEITNDIFIYIFKYINKKMFDLAIKFYTVELN
jgi:hypothetical protein